LNITHLHIHIRVALRDGEALRSAQPITYAPAADARAIGSISIFWHPEPA
jgi:hypothetical protein